MNKHLELLSVIGVTASFSFVVSNFFYGMHKKSRADNTIESNQSILIRRKKHEPLQEKQGLFEKIGFNFYNHTGIKWSSMYAQDYFNDEASYEFEPQAIKQITEATYELHNLCLETVNDVVQSEELMDLFEIPDNLRVSIKESWKNKESDLLGRFDFLYDGINPPKLIEYNADTPTLLIESSTAQSVWAAPKGLLDHQFNFILNALKYVWPNILPKDSQELDFAAPKHHEEEWNQINFLAETAKENFKTYVHDMTHLEFDTGSSKLRALNENSQDKREIKNLYKLYPLEWFCFEEISTHRTHQNKHYRNCNLIL